MAVKAFVETIPPLVGSSLRYLIASVVLAGVLLARGRLIEKPTLPEVLGSVLLGAALLGGGTGLLTIAAPHVDASVAALLFASVPFWMLLLSVFTGSRVARSQKMAVVVGFLGVAILFGNQIGNPSTTNSALGMGLVLAAAGFWAFASYFFTAFRRPASFTVGLLVQTLTAFILMGLAAAAAGDYGRFHVSGVSTASWAGLMFAAVMGSVLGYSAFQRLLARFPASVVATHTFVNPLVAVIAGAAILGESLSLLSLLGGLVIVAAVAVAVSGGADTSARGTVVDASPR